MIPMTVTFKSGDSLTLYSDDPDSFSKSISEAQPPEIVHIEYEPGVSASNPKLQEVKLTLQSGAIILCNIAEEQLPKAKYIEEIIDCDPSTAVAYGKMATQEAELDARFAAASAVVNNLPDLDTRLHLHQAYLKRKAAYVSAVEALVDGVIRRPDE